MYYTVTKDSDYPIHYITVHHSKHSVTFVDFGARIHQWNVPDIHGKTENILLTLDTSEDILNDPAQFGALVGPVAGRIRDAKWKDIQLDKNYGEHHLHGGKNGWWHQTFTFEIEETTHSIKVHFSLIDTSSGYPGPIHVKNTYEVTETEIIMTTECHTEANTLINPTNHLYFNLNGNGQGTIKEHQLKIAAQERLETEEFNLPTGVKLPIAGTAYDFQKSQILSDFLEQIPQGIDDAFTLIDGKKPQIQLRHPENGRIIEIESNRKAVVIFSTTGFDLPLSINGRPMSSQRGIAIETQELPDIPNHPEWGNIELKAHTKKVFQTTYRYRICGT